MKKTKIAAACVDLMVTAFFVVAMGCVLPAFGQSTAAFTTGAFTNNSVLAQAGPASQEVYGVSMGNPSAETTANGYNFGAYTGNTNITYGGSGAYGLGGFLGGGGTSGDTAFNSVLANAELGINNGTLTLKNLTVHKTYQVLFLVVDTRSGSGGRSFSVSSGSGSSATQVYAFTGGTPSLGGYVLATFTASGTTQTFQVSTPGGDQLNGLLVTQINTPTLQPAVYLPTLNSNEAVVAMATPQQFGAVGDGVTDDTAAFQAAINAVAPAGGVVYVPRGTYAFHGNLNLLSGVTLHGDWTDWTTGTGGCVGTTFAIYTTGAANGTPFLSETHISAGLTGINFWYPNQNPNSITPYPFTIAGTGDAMIQNIVLVNSYQGINLSYWASDHVVQTVRGSPLFVGIYVANMHDPAHANDLNFSPNAWAVSGLAGAPTAGGSYATWMRTYGTAMMYENSGGIEYCHGFTFSGYDIGIDVEVDDFDFSLYQVTTTNCGTGLLLNQGRLNASGCTFNGDVGISRTDANASSYGAQFDSCTIGGTSGTAISVEGNFPVTSFQFHNCSITGTIANNGCLVNLTDCTLTGSPQCFMGSNVNTRAYFTGCTFTSGQNITNEGSSGNLQVASGAAVINTLPNVPWSTFATRLASCKPAKTTLFWATSYGATGNGTTDDTAAIQSALTAAGNNGGGIVYLSGGRYKTSSTLTVPSGVRLQGTWEGWLGDTSYSGGSIILPTGGQGGTTGPVAVALAANSGIVGFGFNYTAQIGADPIIAFPPTIQGQGANVYVIGVAPAPTSYIFLDLDTYPCTNHFVDMVHGFAYSQWAKVGGGSSGSMINISGDGYGNGYVTNPNFNAGASTTWLTMGDCTETVDSAWVLPSHDLLTTTAENSKGPNLTVINVGQDGSVGGFYFDSAAASTIDIINAGCADFAQGTDPTDNAAATFFAESTSQFAGKAIFFAPVLGGNPNQNFVINGGTVTAECCICNRSAPVDTISGGVFNLVNYASNSGSETFGASAGISGQTNEVIGTIAPNGDTITNANPANPINAWGNYATSAGGPANNLLAYLICETSGMAMDNNGSTTAGASIYQNTLTTLYPNQQWLFKNAGTSGYYTLTNQASGMNLDNGGSTKAGATVAQWSFGAGNKNQEWEPVSVGNGWYQLLCLDSGLALDNGGSTTKTTLEQNTSASNDNNQNWRIEPIGTPTPAGYVYSLVCVTSGMALDNEASTSANHGIWQWNQGANNPNQEWYITPVDGGYFNVICQRSGMALDDNNATANGTPVVQNPLTAGDADQEWDVNIGNGWCNLISLGSGLALDNEGSTTNAEPVWQWTPLTGSTNQEWQLSTKLVTTITSGSTYNLICERSQMALDNGGSTTSGAALIQNTLVYGDTNQEWQMTTAGTGGYYTLTNQTSGMALDDNGSTTNGTPVVQNPLTAGDANQEWKVTVSSNGFCTLVNLSSGLALDNEGDTYTAGTGVRQATFSSNVTTQQWQLNLLP